MFTVEMLPAGCGDCILIEYGSSAKSHRVLIDGGTLSTSGVLRKRLAETPRLELAVVTHIDTDHIDGMLGLLKEPPPTLEFGEFWFNAYAQASPEGYLGAKQGEFLATELLELEKRTGRKFWNTSTGRRAVMLPDAGPPLTVTLDGDMRVTVLGPTSQGLRRLYKNWDAVMREAGIEPGDPEEALRRLRESRRYRPGWLGEENVEKLADEEFDEDRSPANGSSIVLLLEYETKTCMLTGDAYPSDIVAALGRLPKQGGRQRTQLVAFKVPHHGSANNNSNELYKAIDCARFLVSTNGTIYDHPDPQAIARILLNKRGPADLCFNYLPDQSRRWNSPSIMTKYEYTFRYPGDREFGKKVEL